MKAVGSTHESGACSVGLLHAGRPCAHEVEPRADERIAMDTALHDPESRRSLYDGDSAVLPNAEKKAQSTLTLLKRHLALRERCDTAWTTASCHREGRGDQGDGGEICVECGRERTEARDSARSDL